MITGREAGLSVFVRRVLTHCFLAGLSNMLLSCAEVNWRLGITEVSEPSNRNSCASLTVIREIPISVNK